MQGKSESIKTAEYVDTNIGRIPIDDYKEIMAQQYGF